MVHCVLAWAKPEGAVAPCAPAPARPQLPSPCSAMKVPCRPTGIIFCACDRITQLVKFLVKMATRTAEYDPSFVSTVSLHKEESDIASYSVDISLMFANLIQLNVINFCVLMVNLNKSKFIV